MRQDIAAGRETKRDSPKCWHFHMSNLIARVPNDAVFSLPVSRNEDARAVDHQRPLLFDTSHLSL